LLKKIYWVTVQASANLLNDKDAKQPEVIAQLRAAVRGVIVGHDGGGVVERHLWIWVRFEETLDVVDLRVHQPFHGDAVLGQVEKQKDSLLSL